MGVTADVHFVLWTHPWLPEDHKIAKKAIIEFWADIVQYSAELIQQSVLYPVPKCGILMMDYRRAIWEICSVSNLGALGAGAVNGINSLYV